MIVKLGMLIVFFGVMVGIGLYCRRHATDVNGFVLGGRSVGPWLTAFAYGTSYFSAVVFVGYAGQFGWKYGIAATWAGIGNALLGSLLAWAVLGRRTRIMTQHLSSATMPEFFGKRFGSDKLKIAVDANQGWFFTGKRAVAKWDLKKALNVCRAFEEIGIEWIEEPLYGYDFEGLAELRKRTTLHVAGGELNAQVHEYRDLIKHNCFDIYQMDVVLSGGFVQNRKVAAMAEAENKIYTPHTWTHGMGMAAALHMAGAVSNCPFIEYCYDPPYWPYEVRDMMLTEPLVVDKDGYIAVPQKPGLGVEINHELMDKYTVLRK